MRRRSGRDQQKSMILVDLIHFKSLLSLNGERANTSLNTHNKQRSHLPPPRSKKLTPLRLRKGVIGEAIKILTAETQHSAQSNKHLATRRNRARCNPYVKANPPNLLALKSASGWGVLRR